jgi:hypothetical protein
VLTSSNFTLGARAVAALAARANTQPRFVSEAARASSKNARPHSALLGLLGTRVATCAPGGALASAGTPDDSARVGAARHARVERREPSLEQENPPRLRPSRTRVLHDGHKKTRRGPLCRRAVAKMALVSDQGFQHILRVLNTNVDGRQKVRKRAAGVMP